MGAIIIQIIVFQLCFLIVYELLFRRETFFNWNRAYLLSTSIISLILPFIKLNSFSRVIPQEYAINLPAVILGDSIANQNAAIEQLDTVVLQNNSVVSIMWVWCLGMVFFSCILLLKLYKINFFKRSGCLEHKRGYVIITLKNSEEAFSFFKYIFLGDQIENTQRESILKHEKVHVKEKHTLDLLWFELLRIALWFNPLVYMYQKKITEVHEFIADKSASKYQENYYENLLAKTFNIAQFSVVNQFYSSSLIKKRIIMLTKEKSSRILKLKYLLIAPIITGMLVFTSCESEVSSEVESGKTTILEKIENLKESIAENGEMTKEEYKALKTLLMMTSNDGLENKYFEDVVDKAEVPFGVIDQAPIFPGCDDTLSQEELKKCFSKSISQHVGKEFNTKLANDLNLTGRQKILVSFKINKDGDIAGLKTRAPHQGLAEEAERVINLLPKMIPGKQGGKAVAVTYSLPIVFQVN